MNVCRRCSEGSFQAGRGPLGKRPCFAIMATDADRTREGRSMSKRVIYYVVVLGAIGILTSWVVRTLLGVIADSGY